MAKPIYSRVVRHVKLGKLREIKGNDYDLVEQKAKLQLAQWEEQWQQKQAKLAKAAAIKAQAEQKRLSVESNIEEAAERTQAAHDAISEVKNILMSSLSNSPLNWQTLRFRPAFGETRPVLHKVSDLKGLRSLPPKPLLPDPPDQADFKPALSILSKLIKPLRDKALVKAEQSYQIALKKYNTETLPKLTEWQDQCELIDLKNLTLQVEHKFLVEQCQHDFDKELAAWQVRRQTYYVEVAEHHAEIDKKRADYLNKKADAILYYCELILSASSYPESIPIEVDLEYQSESELLIVNMELPSVECMPTLSEVKWVKSSKSFKEVRLSEVAVNQLYDSAIYQIALRTLYDLFSTDEADALRIIVFNGFVTVINKATGHLVTTCILSIQAKKDDFLAINLAGIDPKACFKQLKGVGSSKLHGLVAIPPILDISREDRRFVDSHDVTGNLDSSSNLAAMDWEEFEHLIREVFSKEFSANGGEVKVTQASRDGGVDAVAFDPDPIRGGKIVIQAKRYTNTVGVSAVRDLFGTVTHEGAMKGILVTTADYGPDAYEFAQGKPLSLLNGANLLYLLEKHGHKARIDLREAKQNAKSAS